jgi:hypothetical protein
MKLAIWTMAGWMLAMGVLAQTEIEIEDGPAITNRVVGFVVSRVVYDLPSRNWYIAAAPKFERSRFRINRPDLGLHIEGLVDAAIELTVSVTDIEQYAEKTMDQLTPEQLKQAILHIGLMRAAAAMQQMLTNPEEEP